MSDRERIAAVEAENIELRSRIAALEAKASPKPRPAAPIDEGDVVRITTVQTYTCAMPTESEYSKLLEIVARAHPQVVPNFEPNRFGSQEDRRQYLAGFVACFRRLESLWRFNGNELGRNRAGIWVAETNRMLGGTGAAEVGLSHFMAAAIAWSDVPYSLGRFPHDVFAGISYSTGDNISSARSAAWRAVLESGKPRPPVAGPQVLYPPPSPVRVFS
jgi:hypothetical protein